MKKNNEINKRIKLGIIIIFLVFNLGNNHVIAAESGALETEDSTKRITDVAFLEVSNYSIDGDVLVPGKDTVLHLDVHNVSPTANAYTVILTVKSNNGKIYPSYGADNQCYIGRVDKDETTTVDIPIKVSTGFDGEFAELECDFTYTSDYVPMGNELVVVLPASGGSLVSVKKVEVSPSAIVNSKTLLSIILQNKSTESITDATLIVKGKVSDDSKSIQLGTLEPMQSYSEDCQITFTESGTQEIAIGLQYTDLNGQNQNTEMGTYTVCVEEQSSSYKTKTTNKALRTNGRIVAGIFFLAVILVMLYYIKKR